MPHPVSGGAVPGRSWRLWPSVVVVSVVTDLVSPRTWLAYIHNVTGLVIGLVSTLATIVLIVGGICLVPLMLIGIPVLGFTMRLADWFARF